MTQPLPENNPAGAVNAAVEPRPMALIENIWRRYRAAAQTAAALKASQAVSRRWALGLGLGGAVLSTSAGILSAVKSPEATWIPVCVSVLGLLTAVSIALAAFVGREVLSPKREEDWVRCRALAEAFKRLTLQALMRVAPYDGDSAADLLRDRARQLQQNTGLEFDGIALDNTGDKPVPRIQFLDEYIEQRLNDQVAYYARAIRRHQRLLKRFRIWILVLGGLAAVTGALAGSIFWAALIVPVLTTGVAALTALVQANRLQTLVPLYQETALQLGITVAHWRDGAKSRAGLAGSALRAAEGAFVLQCEEILSRENESWRAEWQGEGRNGALDAFLKKAEASPAAVDALKKDDPGKA